MTEDCDYLFVVPDTDRRRVLLYDSHHGLRLPRVQAWHRMWVPAAVRGLGDQLTERFGLRARVIRHVQTGETEVCEAELTGSGESLPSEFVWVDRAGASLSGPGRSRVAGPDARVAHEWFEHSAIPDSRAPWERPGWFELAAAWLRSTVRAQGMEPTDAMVVKGAWPGSCVIRQETDQGDFFLKAVFAKPPAETTIVPLLGERFGGVLPAVVAADSRRRWMITRGFGADVDIIGAPEALQRFAGLQLDARDHVPELRGAGCTDMTSRALMLRLRSVAADVERLRAAAGAEPQSRVVPPETVIATLQPVADELANSPIGQSLVHQDFRLGNIAAGPNGPIFYDWSDSVIAHPFFSGARFFDFLPPPEGGSAVDLEKVGDGARAALRDAYLEPFIARFGSSQVRRDFALVWRLQSAFQACRWHRELRYTEPGTPWTRALEQMVPQAWDRATRRSDDNEPSNAFAAFGL